MTDQQKLWYLVVLIQGDDPERPCPIRDMARHIKTAADAIGGYQTAFFSKKGDVLSFFLRTALAPDAILSRISEPNAFGGASVLSPKDKLLCLEIGARLAERGFNMLRHWNEKRVHD